MFRAVSPDSSGHVTPCISHNVKFVCMDWKPPCFTSVSTYALPSTGVLKDVISQRYSDGTVFNKLVPSKWCLTVAEDQDLC